MRFVIAIAAALIITSLASGQPPQIAYPGPVTAVELTGSDWPDVILYTRADGCPPCDRWIRDELPQALRAGLRVLIVPTEQGVTPRFRFRRGEDTVQQEGFVPATRLRQLLR
jgi:hypothetical protein